MNLSPGRRLVTVRQEDLETTSSLLNEIIWSKNSMISLIHLACQWIERLCTTLNFFPMLNLTTDANIGYLQDSTQAPLGFLELLTISERRFGSWSMDFITGLLSCANGCNAIFTCVDHLTKYTVLTAYTLGAGELSA